MSKKMMKRSLALGALMAFVITGSAMANSIVDGKYAWVDDAANVTNVPSGTYNGHSWPIYVHNGATANFQDVESKVSYNTDSVMGISVYYGSTANFNGITNIDVTNTSNDGRARAVNLGWDSTDTAIFNGITLLKATAYDAEGVYASGANPKNVEFKKLLTLDVDGVNGAVGVWVQNGGNVEVAGDAKIHVNSTSGQAEGIFNQHGNQTGNGGGSVSLLGNVEIIAEAPSADKEYVVIHYAGAGSTTIGQKDISKVVLDGNVWAKDGNVNINLGTADSKLTGNAKQEDNGKINISMNGSTWDASGTSENIVNDLTGTGTILVGNDDKVTVVTNNANLTVQQADVTADDVAVENQQEHLEALAEAVVDSNGKSVADTVAIAEGAVVGAVTAKVVVDENGDAVAGKAVEAVNTVNQSIGEAAVNLKAHYRAHMNDMNKRMGELRMANGETGVWTRMVRGENEYEGAKSQYNQYQLGYDEKLSVDKRWTVGAAVTFAEGSGNFTNGSTEDDSTAFAIYGSKLNNDGSFVDLIARYARLESDITMGANKADYSTNGMSVSAEFGKRIQQGNGLWIEPQVELTYGTVDSAEYTIAGRNVQVGDMDSLIGRVGFSLGKDIKQGNVYARASYLYDFDGETETTFGNGTVTRTIEEDLGGGWWEVGVGANINLSKATYIYADVEKTFGGEVDTNWQWNLGVRYSF